MADLSFDRPYPGPYKADLAKVNMVPALAAAMPAVEEYVERKLKALDNKVFSLLDKGGVSPDAALSFWHERKSLKRLISGLNNTNDAAVGAGERLEQLMNR